MSWFFRETNIEILTKEVGMRMECIEEACAVAEKEGDVAKPRQQITGRNGNA